MKTRLGKLAIAIAASGSALSVVLFSVVPAHGSDNDTVSLGSEVQSGLPVRLRIPSIKVNSDIEYVGLTPSGAMDVPKKDLNVGWFSPGTRPGEMGSAVIAGHYSWRNHGQGGVFHNLDKLRQGDKLYIEDNNGKVLSFVVQENRLFNYNADTREVFTSSSSIRLNLITCAGIWEGSRYGSTKRRVVFTELVPQIPTNFS